MNGATPVAVVLPSIHQIVSSSNVSIFKFIRALTLVEACSLSVLPVRLILLNSFLFFILPSGELII